MKTILEILASTDPTVQSMLAIVGIVLGGVLLSLFIFGRKTKTTDL